MSATNASLLVIVPVTFAQACDFVAEHHRHLPAPAGHKFSAGVVHVVTGALVGVVIVGRPVARHLDDGQTLEVTRTATDGTRNACSALYGTAWRAAQALGYTRLITYTQPDSGETGASLRAAGWTVVAQRRRHAGWNRRARPRADRGSAGVRRALWQAPASSPPASAVVEALIAANCCGECGADVGRDELGRFRGMCRACFTAVEQASLEFYDLDVEDLYPPRPLRAAGHRRDSTSVTATEQPVHTAGAR
ncbi:XF1762 family protein [Lentzea sp. NPDC042327]|uniref:XF1762 family protein n=1 Tax=Lentzea sp. NPDC042327 TaxID=3154801 RepID=UPI00340A00A2